MSANTLQTHEAHRRAFDLRYGHLMAPNEAQAATVLATYLPASENHA